MGSPAANLWAAKVVVLAATLTMIAIRAPHGRRSRRVKVVKSHKTSLRHRPFGSGVDWVLHPFDLARVTSALVRRVPASPWPVRRGRDLLRDGPLVVLQVAR